MAKDQNNNDEPSPTMKFVIGMGRAFGGAILFAIPMIMTMEMWWLGFYMERQLFALLLLANIPLLIGLSHYSGFEATFEWKADALDAFAAYAVGFVTAAIFLPLLGVIEPGSMSFDEILGKIALQSVPSSIGALLAQSQITVPESQKTSDEKQKEERKRHTSYGGELFLMMVGALFLAFNLAPTEEMILIAFKMSRLQSVALALLSIILMHATVYVLFTKIAPDVSPPADAPFWSIFLRFTVVGYALVLLVSLFVLWIFGRTFGTAVEQILMMMIVLAFPGAMGAAAARIII